MENLADLRRKRLLGEILREMIDRRGLRQKSLAQRIHLTESSLSNILNGRARPRQVTLSKLIKQLEATPEEQQKLLGAYEQNALGGAANLPTVPEYSMSEDEVERVRHYLELKSLSVTFQEDVEKRLGVLGFQFQRAFRDGPLITDFLLPGPPRLAIECKYNLNRDWDKTVTSVKLLKENLGVEAVLVVIPYENETSDAHEQPIKKLGGRIVMLSNLEASIRSLVIGKERDA